MVLALAIGTAVIVAFVAWCVLLIWAVADASRTIDREHF